MSCTEIYRQGYFGCKGGSELLLTTDCITVRVPTELALLQKILCWLIGTPCIIYIHLEVWSIMQSSIYSRTDCSTSADSLIAPQIPRLGAVDDVEPKHMLAAWQSKRMLVYIHHQRTLMSIIGDKTKGVLSIGRGNK